MRKDHRSKSTGETPAEQARHKKGIMQIERENLKPSIRDKRKPGTKPKSKKL